MKDIIKNIILTAQSLEVKGLKKEASALDSIAEDLLMVKKAQYDGVQGYWLRNGRCFNNCYRQKRTDSPEKSAQEIWSECHSEWQSSIMSNSSSTWDKYAEKGDLSDLKKVASVSEAINSDIVMNEEIKEKMLSGIDISDAVPMTVAERMFSLPWKLSQISNSVSELSLKISEEDPAISERLYGIAEDIRQESLNNYKDCLI